MRKYCKAYACNKALVQNWIVLDDNISKIRLEDIFGSMDEESEKISKTLKNIQDFIAIPLP